MVSEVERKALLDLLAQQKGNEFQWIRGNYETTYEQPEIFFVEDDLEISSYDLLKKMESHFELRNAFKERLWKEGLPLYQLEMPIATQDQINSMANNYIERVKESKGLSGLPPLTIAQLKTALQISADLYKITITSYLEGYIGWVSFVEGELQGIQILIAGNGVNSAYHFSVNIIPTLIGFFNFSEYLSTLETEGYEAPTIYWRGVSFLQTFMKKNQAWYLQFIIEDKKVHYPSEEWLYKRHYDLTHGKLFRFKQ